MLRNFLVLMSFLLLCSCATIKGIEMSDVNLGMTKTEVQAKTKSFQTKTIGARKYKDGTI